MHRLQPRPRVFLAAGLLACAACGGPSAPKSESGLIPGTLAANPATGGLFVVAPNQGGQASAMVLERAVWGRLVDLHDTHATTGEKSKKPLFRDLLVDPLVESDGVDFLLERDPGTGRDVLVVLHPRGTSAFHAARKLLEEGLQLVKDKGLSLGELPPYSAWPRNAALALVFDDLLDDGGDPGELSYPGTVKAATIAVSSGYPPLAPVALRVLPDPNHGDLVDGRFHSTRVLLDPAVSEHEALSSGVPTNPVGLPAAAVMDQPNVGIRIATRVNTLVGQLEVLTNLSGHELDATRSGPSDPGSPTLDVVRALRSGSGALGDPHNGFLPDDIAPQLLGVQAVSLANVLPQGGGEFLVDLSFASLVCAPTPRSGDVIRLTSSDLVVTQPGSSPVGGAVAGVSVRVLSGNPNPVVGSGQYRTPFDASAGQIPACFVVFTGGAALPPDALVAPSTAVTLSFDEALDPDSVEVFDTFELTDMAAPAGQPLAASVVGQVLEKKTLDSFTFAPALPLRHAAGVAETFRVEVGELRDLAGNPLAVALPAVDFTLDPAATALDSGGLTLTFSSTDEDGNGAAELRGQVVFDLARGVLQPRAVSRMSSLVDTSSFTAPTVQAWTPLFGFREPLSEYGSRVTALWRYHDLGFGLMDEDSLNVDVEGLAWQPEIATVSIDHFPEFEVALGHSNRLPDEWIDPVSGLVIHPNSGPVNTFSANELHPTEVVHPRGRGYLLTPVDSFLAASGMLLAPWPLNRGVPAEEFSYFTYRDTAIQALGGPNGQGVDTLMWMMLTGTGSTLYGADQVPSLGLPLLMEFKCWPNPSSLGTNRVMMGMANTVGLPYFRAWSGGFVTNTGQTTLVDPDTETSAKGGVDPAGNSIPGLDIGVMYGQVDFVVRVSRAHTVWFDTQGPSQFSGHLLDPPQFDQPHGTQVQVAFRGATILGSAPLWSDASFFDPYGDPVAGQFSVLYLNNDSSWKADLSELDGARYVQARVTMVSNAATSISPEISSLAISYFK